ncbi:MAG: hypothetical protein V2A58_12120 [Planctomycetota bacterium]
MTVRGILAFAVTIMGSSFAQAADGPSPWDAKRSVPVCTDAHDQEHPAISSAKQGLIVMWQDNRPEGKTEGTKFPWSVRGMVLKHRKEFVVFCPPDSNAMTPAISGDRVALVHNRGWSNVLVIGLPRGEPNTLDGVAFTPAIDGELVTFTSAKHRWEGWTGKSAPPASWITDIVAYEMGGIGLPFDVTNSDTLNQNEPDVSGTTVVWQQGSQAGGWSNYGIYKRDINVDPEPVRISRNPGKSAQKPTICGTVIVWQDNRNGDWDIYGYDLQTKEEMEICRAPGDQEAPAINGQTVVWQDNRRGDWDIYGCDLNPKSVFAVYEGKGDQTEPDVCGDVVVWTDTRDGNKDIYMNRKTSE